MVNQKGVNLNLLLTYKCNFACKHCLSNCGPHREERMTFEQAKDYIDQIISVIKVGFVGYTGGEPFLYYDMLRDLVSYTYHKYGIIGGVVTNCSWAKNESRAKEKLDELYQNGLRSLVVSCDSYHLQYGSLDSIRYVVHRALELGISLCINTVVTKDVKICKNDVPKLLNLSENDFEKDITIKEIGPIKMGRTLTHIEEKDLIETEDPHYYNGNCPFVINTPTITPNGSVFACCCFGNAEETPHELIGYCGNVNSDSFKNIFEGMEKNLLFNLLAHHGPYQLLEMVKKQQRNIKIRGKYLSTCDVCVELYHNPDVRKGLSDLLNALREDIP